MKPSFLLVFLLSAGLSYAQPSTENSKPFILGVIDELPSTILAEKRVLNIYLPEGYARNDTARYPVVYLLDGSADEDFIHITGLYQFNNFSWINRVPKSIIVGIANVDRERDFSYPVSIAEDKKNYPNAGGSEKFIAFLEKELQPHIAKKYRTGRSRTIIGQSLGGLLATEILLKKPALFDQYIIISPSLWWDNGSLLKLKPAPVDAGTGVYIGVGKEGLGPGAIPHVMEVDANILADKLRTEAKNLTVHFDYLPQENHATVAHQAVFNALRLLYPGAADKK